MRCTRRRRIGRSGPVYSGGNRSNHPFITVRASFSWSVIRVRSMIPKCHGDRPLLSCGKAHAEILDHPLARSEFANLGIFI
jgi:hypothetical protein